jgi:type III pantothenate kinase
MKRADQLLLIDIGNTSTGMALWSDGKRQEARHVPTEPTEPIENAVAQLWAECDENASRVVVVSSVRPSALEAIRSFAGRQKIEPFLVINEHLPAPIGTDLPDPAKIGCDRLCAAAAAYEQVKTACVVADFGTALTIDLVADNGVFLGGTIMPGLGLSARALHEHTALLPLVKIEGKREPIGKDTNNAIRNGVLSMFIGALREVTEAVATDIGKWPPLIVTGGDAEIIAGHCDFVDRVVPDLCLDGVALAYHKFLEADAQE